MNSLIFPTHQKSTKELPNIAYNISISSTKYEQHMVDDEKSFKNTWYKLIYVKVGKKQQQQKVNSLIAFMCA